MVANNPTPRPFNLCLNAPQLAGYSIAAFFASCLVFVMFLFIIYFFWAKSRSRKSRGEYFTPERKLPFGIYVWFGNQTYIDKQVDNKKSNAIFNEGVKYAANVIQRGPPVY